MRVFVTGATGLLGNTIVRQLAEQGHSVSVLVRNAPSPDVFEGVDVECVYGDLAQPVSPKLAHPNEGCEETHNDESRDDDTADVSESDSRDSWVSHLAHCDAVIHCAGLIHLGWKRLDESMRVNRDGTKQLAQTCKELAKRLIYVGTVNSIAVGTETSPANELTPLENGGGQVQSSYVLSKRAALLEVKAAAAEGLDTVIVHPGFMLGPWDWKPSSGQMMLELSSGWKLICPSGGCSVCDSRDVAAATIAALEYSGESGREFILAGENMTYQDLWIEMTKRFDRRPPVMTLRPGQKFLGGIFGDLKARITGIEPAINSASLAMSSQFHWYSSDRARSELGYRTRNVQKTLDDAADWIRKRFVAPP